MSRWGFLLLSLFISFSSIQVQACPKISVGGVIETQQFNIRASRLTNCPSIRSIFSCSSDKELTSVTETRNGEYVSISVTCKKDLSHRYRAPSNKKIVQSSGTKELSAALTGPASGVMTASLGTDVATRPSTALITPTLYDLAKNEGLDAAVLNKAFRHFKTREGKGHTKRGCFMAGDLTLPNGGKLFLVCMSPEKVLPLSTVTGKGFGSGCYGHPYTNRTECTKYFSNKRNYCLSMGGAFATKFAVRSNGSKRTFVELEGLEEYNKNALSRQVGMMQAIDRSGNRISDPKSHGAFVVNDDLSKFDIEDLGFNDTGREFSMYIYPSADDINDVIKGKRGAYWNKQCLSQIQKPGWIGEDEFFLDKKASWPDEVKFFNESPSESDYQNNERQEAEQSQGVD